jgi:SOS-response transcriptional repressor LexA
MNKMKLAAVLKTLLQKRNLSESELSRRTGVCQPVIHRMASGETDNPKIETLRPIARYFSISLDQLVGDAPLTSEYVFHVEQELFNLPLISPQDAALWPENKQDIVATLVQTDVKISDLAYAIRLKDSTMYPMFPDGTLLIIEPKESYNHRDFVIARIKNQPQVLFKQLLLDGADQYLKSVNADYPPIKINPSDKILGVMLQARIDFRKN